MYLHKATHLDGQSHAPRANTKIHARMHTHTHTWYSPGIHLICCSGSLWNSSLYPSPKVQWNLAEFAHSVRRSLIKLNLVLLDCCVEGLSGLLSCKIHSFQSEKNLWKNPGSFERPFLLGLEKVWKKTDFIPFESGKGMGLCQSICKEWEIWPTATKPNNNR